MKGAGIEGSGEDLLKKLKGKVVVSAEGEDDLAFGRKENGLIRANEVCLSG